MRTTVAALALTFLALVHGAGVAAVLPTPPPEAAATTDAGMPEVQIRAYFDRFPLRSSPGQWRYGVFLYGMRVREDGSETVVWSKKVFEPIGLKWLYGEYEIAVLSPERVYLHFSEGARGRLPMPRPDPPLIWEMDPRSGEIVRVLEAHAPEFPRLRASLQWWSLPVVYRPRLPQVEPQRGVAR